MVGPIFCRLKKMVAVTYAGTRIAAAVSISMFFYTLPDENLVTAAPCDPLEQLSWEVRNTADALSLSQAVECEGGIFAVEWTGSVVLSRNISIAEETTLNITGFDASIQGNGATRLFYLYDTSELHLQNLELTGGQPQDVDSVSDGGAIHAGFDTVVSARDCFFKENRASGSGGAIVSSGLLVVDGATRFAGNSAGFAGGENLWFRRCWRRELSAEAGANSAIDGDQIEIRGNTTFVDNYAESGAGGAVSSDTYTVISGFTSFINNTAGYEGGAISGYNPDVFIVVGSTMFLNNTAERGGALWISSPDSRNESTVYIEGDAEFNNNVATGAGGAIYAESQVLIMNGSFLFTNNSAGIGGAINCEECDLSMTREAIFAGNSAIANGASRVFELLRALSVSSMIHIVYIRLTIVKCTKLYLDAIKKIEGVKGIAHVRKGALHSVSQSKIFFEGTFSFNGNGGEDGGAIFIEDYVDPIGIVASFSDNYATSNGGAIVAQTSEDPFSVVKSTFRNNSAGTSGGALFFVSLDRLFIEETAFLNNSAQRDGGAVTTVECGGEENTRYESCTFIGNAAANDGGAIFTSVSIDEIHSSHFLGNIAGSSGGALLQGGLLTNMNYCVFEGNKATERGPAIFNIGSNEEWFNNTFIDNTFKCMPGEYLEEDFNAALDDLPTASCSLTEEEAGLSRYEVVCDDCPSSCNSCTASNNVPSCCAVMENTFAEDSGVTLSTLSLEKGYWRSLNTSREIRACYNTAACDGGSTVGKYCSVGYTGPFCAVCEEDYAAGLSYTCHQCNSTETTFFLALAILVVFLVAAIGAFTFWDYVTAKGHNMRKFTSWMHILPFQRVKILVVVWQIITQFSSLANASFPEVYERFLNTVDVINFDIGWIMSVSCIADTTFYFRLFFSTLGPLVVLSVLAVIFLIAWKRKEESTGITTVMQTCIGAALLLTFLIYSSVSANVFRTFVCDEVDSDSGQLWYLRADHRLECFTPQHHIAQVYSGFMIFVYPVGIPLSYALLIFRNADLLKASDSERQSNPQLSTFKSLWKPYKQNCFYYEVVDCFRRLLLTGLVVFIYPNTVAQIAITAMIALLFLVLSEILRPYENIFDSWLARSGHIIVFLSLYLALLSKADTTGDEGNSREVLAVVLVVVHCAMIAAIVVESVLVAVAGCRTVEEDKSARRLPEQWDSSSAIGVVVSESPKTREF